MRVLSREEQYEKRIIEIEHLIEKQEARQREINDDMNLHNINFFNRFKFYELQMHFQEVQKVLEYLNDYRQMLIDAKSGFYEKTPEPGKIAPKMDA